MRACVLVRVCARVSICALQAASVFVRLCFARLYLYVLSVVAGKEQQLVLRDYIAQILTVLALPAACAVASIIK